ncbi:MAG: diguanylate cyclase [Pyrinomonadaceae bacterium]
MDGLTNIPNRRYFDEFLDGEWKRCRRLSLPLSVAIMEIDHFKLLNDHYGHPSGDACLVKIGEKLNKIKKRPGDIFARYGGEEFAFVFDNATSKQALVPINKIVDNIRKLEIPNTMSPTDPNVTVSVGLATMFPDSGNDEKQLLKAADTIRSKTQW